MKLGCILMAAGLAERFGGNKLLAVLDGKTLIQRALDCVPDGRFRRVCVVSQGGEIARLAGERGFVSVINSRPELGASRSIALGLGALGQADAAMFMVCDQPLLRRESVSALLELYLQHPEHIAALESGGVRGNPCIFPRRFFPELLALTGDRGGRAVIQQHPDELELLSVSGEELFDIDHRSDLLTLE